MTLTGLSLPCHLTIRELINLVTWKIWIKPSKYCRGLLAGMRIIPDSSNKLFKLSQNKIQSRDVIRYKCHQFLLKKILWHANLIGPYTLSQAAASIKIILRSTNTTWSTISVYLDYSGYHQLCWKCLSYQTEIPSRIYKQFVFIQFLTNVTNYIAWHGTSFLFTQGIFLRHRKWLVQINHTT